MHRTLSDLQNAADHSGATLVDAHDVPLSDGTSALAGDYTFDDPWIAADLLVILAEEDASDPIVIDLANEIYDAAMATLARNDSKGQARDAFLHAVHHYVQQNIRFAPEVGERFQSAATTLVEGVGDCDCHARLVYAIARALGLAAQIRFLEVEGEPVHAVAALGTSTGYAWAETTIAAEFGEHPQAAYRRLGLDQTHERPDIGFLGIDFVTPSDVETRKSDLDAAVMSLDHDVAACANLDPETRDAWEDFLRGWHTFANDKAGFWSAGAQGRQAADYATEIQNWQTMIGGTCRTTAPRIPDAPTDQTVSVVKTVAIAGAVIAAGYAVTKGFETFGARARR